jgi:hypothetical protein
MKKYLILILVLAIFISGCNQKTITKEEAEGIIKGSYSGVEIVNSYEKDKYWFVETKSLSDNKSIIFEINSKKGYVEYITRNGERQSMENFIIQTYGINTRISPTAIVFLVLFVVISVVMIFIILNQKDKKSLIGLTLGILALISPFIWFSSRSLFQILFLPLGIVCVILGIVFSKRGGNNIISRSGLAISIISIFFIVLAMIAYFVSNLFAR